MAVPSDIPLVKQIHEAGHQIEAIECKIQFADLQDATPSEFEEMRAQQEEHRQRILKCRGELTDQSC